jgi:hypothetical protein
MMCFEREVCTAPELEVTRVHDERPIRVQTELRSQRLDALGRRWCERRDRWPYQDHTLR